MPIDPVQSIRVAANLAERFGVLMTPGSMEVAELELKIGEAQQLYPEIWRHLDDARTALAAQGRDVAVFDDVRRGELAQLGVTDTESTTSLDYAGLIMGQLGTVQFKSATFNEAGYRRALAACRALMAAMPEVDWKAVAHEEQRAAREAGSLHSAKWKGGAKLIVIAAALLGVCIIAYRVLTNVKPDEPPPSATQQRHEVIDHQRDKQRLVRIDELRETYALTCDRYVQHQLVTLLRDAGQGGEADKLGSAPCVPKRPSCDAVKEAIAQRIATQLDLVRDNKAWSITCQGILITRPYQPGLAVVVTARDKQKMMRVLRGVVSSDGARDLVEFTNAPAATLAAVADLDHDSGEELVFVDSTSLTVSRVTARGFEDVDGPALPNGCAVTVTAPSHRLVVESSGTQCVASGRRTFLLKRGGLSETK